MSAAQAPAEILVDDIEQDGTDSTNQFVSFSIGSEMFAVPMGPVQEIIRVPEVAQLPLAPFALLGLANLRGRVLPIISLRRLFNVPDHPQDDATRALVINLGQPLGFVVDRVASVVGVDPGEIESAAAIQSIADVAYLTGVIKRHTSDGREQMLLTLNFEQLVGQQFGQLLAQRIQNTIGHGEQTITAITEDDVATDELRLVSFTVAEQEYAIDIVDVQEIVQVPEQISVIPKAPAHLLGLITLRQRLLPLISLRTLFSLPAVELGEHHRIVVIALPDGSHVGLVTDGVKEVLSVPKQLTDAMPQLLARDEQLQEFASICRLDDGKRLVSIIATDRLLHMPAVAQAMQFAAASDGHTHSEDTMTSEFDEDDNAEDESQVVIFRLGAEEFGVPIMTVQEIVRIPETLTTIPKTPKFVEGVINLRGTVLPVIDQRRRLGMDPLARNEGQRIMVYSFDGVRTGFIVDAVAEVLRIPNRQIEAAPALSEEQGELIARIAKLNGNKRMVMLIEPRALLGARELTAVSNLISRQSAASAAPAALPDAA